MKYTVYFVGKSKSGQWKDGETLFETNEFYGAITFAEAFMIGHPGEFDKTFGGIGIKNKKNEKIIEWQGEKENV